MDSRSGEETSRADYDLAASPDRHDGDGLQANLEVNLAGQSHSSCRTQPSIVSDYHLGKPLVHIHANSRVASPAHPLLVPLLCGGGSSGQNGNCDSRLRRNQLLTRAFGILQIGPPTWRARVSLVPDHRTICRNQPNLAEQVDTATSYRLRTRWKASIAASARSSRRSAASRPTRRAEAAVSGDSERQRPLASAD